MQTKTTLEYLDGNRGFLANTVIIAHLGQHAGLGVVSPIVQPIVNAASQHIGVVGFFVLSAFLLTYRLMIDFDNAKTTRICLIRAVQYVIRRFFRIYLVFVIYWTLVKFGPHIFKGYFGNGYSKYLNGLILSSIGSNHLWTIPPEIKYYFCIPIISFVSIKCGKYWFILWLLSSFAMFYVDTYNPFHFDPEFKQKNPELGPRFATFFAGSQLAILFFHLEQMPTVRNFAGKHIIKHILSVCLTIIFVSQFILFYYFNKNVRGKFAYKVPRSYPHIGYQVMSIFVLLYVNSTNLITNLLNSYYLRMCGRYSFGIYLLHPVAIQIFKNFRQYISIKYHRDMLDLTFPKMFIVIGLTYVLALMWFHVLENNLIRIANKIAKWIDINFNGSVRTVLVS